MHIKATIFFVSSLLLLIRWFLNLDISCLKLAHLGIPDAIWNELFRSWNIYNGKKKINHYVNPTLIYRNSIYYRFLVLLLNELVLPKSYKSFIFRFHFILLELAFSFYNRCSPRNSIPNLSTSPSSVFQLKFFSKHLRHTATADTQEMIVISSQEKPSHRLLLVSCKLFYARVCT